MYLRSTGCTRVYTTGCTRVYTTVYTTEVYLGRRKPLREEASCLPKTERNLCAKRPPASLRKKEKPLREEASPLPKSVKKC